MCLSTTNSFFRQRKCSILCANTIFSHLSLDKLNHELTEITIYPFFDEFCKETIDRSSFPKIGRSIFFFFFEIELSEIINNTWHYIVRTKISPVVAQIQNT